MDGWSSALWCGALRKKTWASGQLYGGKEVRGEDRRRSYSKSKLNNNITASSPWWRETNKKFAFNIKYESRRRRRRRSADKKPLLMPPPPPHYCMEWVHQRRGSVGTTTTTTTPPRQTQKLQMNTFRHADQVRLFLRRSSLFLTYPLWCFFLDHYVYVCMCGCKFLMRRRLPIATLLLLLMIMRWWRSNRSFAFAEILSKHLSLSVFCMMGAESQRTAAIFPRDFFQHAIMNTYRCMCILCVDMYLSDS